jgi:aspartokinase
MSKMKLFSIRTMHHDGDFIVRAPDATSAETALKNYLDAIDWRYQNDRDIHIITVVGKEVDSISQVYSMKRMRSRDD